MKHAGLTLFLVFLVLISGTALGAPGNDFEARAPLGIIEDPDPIQLKPFFRIPGYGVVRTCTGAIDEIPIGFTTGPTPPPTTRLYCIELPKLQPPSVTHGEKAKSRREQSRQRR